MRRDQLRRRLGLPSSVVAPADDIFARNAQTRKIGWLVGMGTADLAASATVLRPERENAKFHEKPSRAFKGTAINRQYWDVRDERPLTLFEYRDVMIASTGNTLSIFRDKTVDERAVGLVVETRRLDPEKVATLGTVALCDDYFFPSNPCHVIVDRMTRAAIFSAHGVDEGDISFTFGPSRAGPYVQAKVFPRARTLDTRTVYRVERLLVLSTTFQPNHGHPFWYGDPAIMRRILDPLLADLPAGGGERLYLARTDATRRPLLDELELIARLQADGFRAVVMGELSPHEQLSLCRGASVIVGPHGAAMTNAIAAAPGTRVVELFNSEIGSAVYAICSHLRGHDYRPLFGRPVADAGEDAWTIDIEAVRAAALG